MYKPYRSDGNLGSSVYGNGDTVSYTYDDLDRVTSTNYNGVKTYEYVYNKEGLLAKQKDNENSVTTTYEYDFARRLLSSTSTDGLKADYTYDERNNVKSIKLKKGSVTLNDTAFTYATDGLISRVSWSTLGSAYRTNSYDSLNRLTKNSLSVSAPTNATKSELNTQYTYLSNGTNATGLVSRLKYTNLFEGHSSLGSGEFALRTFDYTYDANGNIKTVTTDGVLTDSYTYDGLNQLVRHDDAAAGKSYIYSYEAGGNITSKKEYAYTTGTLGTVLSEKSYAYDSVWKDKLVSYDGKAITYDEIGNPLTFDGYTFSWQKGRQLASIDGNVVNLDFKYNSDGLRTKKISSDKTIEYYYSGSVLMAQYDGTNWLKFCYSADGEIVGFAYNNTPYYFVKNLQGDIVGIMNSASELVCIYKYDAWGKCTVYDSSGAVNTSSTFIGNVNPLRYRGYYYDAETGLYYASSRYYNPEICRWINADGVMSDVGGDVRGYNLFAYCFNNPVNMTDETGAFPKWAKKVVAAATIVAVVAVVAVVTIYTAGAGTAAAIIAVGAAKGAAIGMASGAAIGAATGAVSHRVSTGSWSGAGTATLNGMGDGALSGAITGAITGAAGSAVKVSQAAKAWDNGTFKSGYQSMKYHYNKHVVSEGLTKGNNVLKYTHDAVSFANRNSSVLKYTYNYNYGNVSWNSIYSTGRGGMFTSTGKVLTFWYR